MPDMPTPQRYADLFSRRPTPEDLFRAAQRDPLIKTFLMEWRGGHLTWEQMLLRLVLELSAQKRQLMEPGKNIYGTPIFYYYPDKSQMQKVNDVIGIQRTSDSLATTPAPNDALNLDAVHNKNANLNAMIDRIAGKLPVSRYPGSRCYACEQCGKMTDVPDGAHIECNYCSSSRLHLFMQMPADEPVTVPEKPA